VFAASLFAALFRRVAVDACGWRMHFRDVSKPKKAKASAGVTTPGTVIAAKIRARANYLTDGEREALMGNAMRIIYASEA